MKLQRTPTVQKTLKRVAELKGVGLHSGRPASIRILPAEADHGIVFVRSDLKDSPRIPGRIDFVMKTQMQTVIGQGSVAIATIEHLMAALGGLQIDNALIEVDGPEVPIMDGSSEAFLKAIKKAGILNQDQARVYLKIKKRVEIKLDEKWAYVEPASDFSISASVEWDHPSIGYQEFRYSLQKSSFSEIASARTFGFLRDVNALKAAGLALGGSLDNAVVLDEALVLNPDGLRFPNEFVRHKVLDAIGDLKLAGLEIMGHFRLHRAGHEIHRKLLAEILSDTSNYEIVTQEATEEYPLTYNGALALQS